MNIRVWFLKEPVPDDSGIGLSSKVRHKVEVEFNKVIAGLMINFNYGKDAKHPFPEIFKDKLSCANHCLTIFMTNPNDDTPATPEEIKAGKFITDTIVKRFKLINITGLQPINFKGDHCLMAEDMFNEYFG